MSIRPVAPDAARVWRGFKSDQISQDDFFQRLGSVFVPSTVLMQIDVGLWSYTPTIPCGMKDKPAAVPDETAILFWETTSAHDDAFKTLSARTYTLTHGACYTPESSADVPIFFDGSLISSQSYFLMNKAADWMHGRITHLIAGPKKGVSTANWYSSITKIMLEIQSRGELEGGIVCVTDSYLVYWQLGADKDVGVSRLQSVAGWSTLKTPAVTSLKHGMYDYWPGMSVSSGDSFNMQWTRKKSNA